jgi:RimJ/RimL family protein N-acetyltransferase
MIILDLITPKDAIAFMNLRNDEETYRWFYSGRKFTLEEVESWIGKLDPTKDRVFIARQDDTIVGTCSLYNIDWQKKTAETGRIITAPHTRGKGFGTQMLQQLTKIAIADGLQSLYANIKKDNVSSQRAYEKAGYTRIEERFETGYYYMRGL